MKHRFQVFIAGFIGCTVISAAMIATAQPNAGEPQLSPSRAWPHAGDILLRQIARQSFFLAEREGLHLPTRDASLGEAGGDANSTIQPLVTVFAEQVDLKISLVRQVGQKPLWSTTIVRGDEPSDYQAAVERAEVLSRGELLDALRKAGLTAAPAGHGTKATGEIPKEIEDKLEQMDFCSQFVAVRAAHEALRASPDSPLWLGVLVRGYANLGQLTGYFWNTAPQAFAARSLLYAQRWVATEPGSGNALRYRAYAYALAGFQAIALEDLSSADQLPAGGEKPPSWVQLLGPYCRYETAKLLQSALAAPKQAAQLPLFLCFLTIEHSRLIAVVDTYGNLAIDESPDNLRVVDKMILQSGVVPNYRLTDLNLLALRSTIPARIATMPGLPDSVRGAATRKGKILDHAAVAVITAALMDSAAGGKDAGEPSWGVLGGLMSEAQFMAVERRVYFETRMLAIDSRPFIEEAKPLFSSHPFAAYIQSYTLPRSAVAQRKALLQHLKFPEAQIKSFRLWSALAEAGLDTGANNPGDPAVDWTRLALVNGDTTSIDGQYEFEAGTTDIHSDAAKKLAKVSPRHPALIAERIEEDWDQISGRLAELEPGWGDHPTILAALAQQFISVDDPNKARPYLERLIEQAPDFWAIDALAKTYLDHDDEAGWLKTLRRGLAAPDFGLYHADYNAEIADHFMGKKDYKTAKPYADAAGSSYSSNGLMTAARCEEGLGNWVTAEQWIHRDAERYDHPFAWLTWCVRTGHGNRAAAIEFGIPAIQPVDGMELDRESMAVRASFLLLAGKNTDATAMLRQMLKTYGDPWAGLHLALLSEAAHDTSGRDEALKMVIERGTDLRVNDDSPRPQLVELAGIFRGYLAADAGATLDLAAVDRLTDHLHPPEAANINYMTAKLLDLRNHKPEADRYYVRAAAGPAESTSRILAVQELRARPTATTAPRR